MDSKVSIIIPIYNASMHLDLCLNSVLNQTYKNLEIIMINDGSTDNSVEIIKKYQKEDKRIVLFNQKNQGVAKTRNKGIRKSSGEYLMFIDQDDYIDDDYIERLLSKMKKNDLDILVGGYVRESYETHKIMFKDYGKETNIAPYILIVPWGKLYRTSYAKNFEFMDSTIADEYLFNVMAYNNTDKIAVIEDFGYHWMFNEKSVSNTKHKGLKNTDELIRVLDKLVKSVSPKDKDALNYFYVRACIYYILFSCKKVNISEIMTVNRKFMKWLKVNAELDNFRKNRYIKYRNSECDSLKVKMIIHTYLLLNRIHLLRPALWLYSHI